MISPCKFVCLGLMGGSEFFVSRISCKKIFTYVNIALLAPGRGLT